MNMKKKKVAILSGLLIAILITTGATIAFLTDKTDGIVNTFNPSTVEIGIEEEFENNIKTDVYFTNTENDTIPVYVRVKLVHSWYHTVDGNEKQAAKADWTITPENMATINSGNEKDWFYCEEDGFYYYKMIVPVNGETSNLIDTITLLEATDGTYQALEIYAEAIQADGGSKILVDGEEVWTPAVTQAWGVTVNDNGTISK